MHLRKRSAQTQLFRIARVNAGYKWRDQIFQQRRAKFPPRKIRNRFVALRRKTPPQRFRNQPPQCALIKKRRCQQRRRRHRRRHKFSIQINKSRCPLRCRKYFAGQPRILNQFVKLRRDRETLRPRFNQVTVFLRRPRVSAETRRLFQQHKWSLALPKNRRARKPGNSAADNHHWRSI